MILSAPVAIEESSVAADVPIGRLSTPKLKTSLYHSKPASSSNFDSAFPIFPEIGAVAAGAAKYEVFMAAGGGKMKEIKVRTFLFPLLPPSAM
jgi:hypothetical protein